MKIVDNYPNLIDSLKTVRHFRNLSLAELHTIITSGKIRRFEAIAIFTKGNSCIGMFVLMKGCVRLGKLGSQGKVNIMTFIKPMILFNEVAARDGGPNPLSANTVENFLVWQINHESFLALVEPVPQVGLSLLGVLAKLNREMISHYEDLSFRSVEARTTILLLDLSDNGRKSINRPHCSIEKMASQVATVPEAISRSLYVIKSSGTILASRTEIAIVSSGKLAEVAHIGSSFID